VSIRWTLLALTALLLATILGSGFWMNRQSLTREMGDLSKQELSLLAESIRSHLVRMMRSGVDDQTINAEVETLNRQWQTTLDLRLLPGPAIDRQFGTGKHTEPLDALEKRGLTENAPIVEEGLENNTRLLRFIYPLRAEKLCLQCHEARLGEHLGAIAMKMDISLVRKQIQRSNNRIIWTYLAESLLLLLLLAYMMHMLVFKRLIALRRGAEHIAAGQYDHRIKGESHNELGVVIREFNHMAHRVRTFSNEREERIREQITQLSFLEGMSQTLTKTLPLDNIMSQFVRSLTESTGVTCASIALLAEDRRSLEISASYSVRKMPEIIEPGQSCNKPDFPTLWQIMSNRAHRLIDDFDALSDLERKLFKAHDAEAVLCLPIAGRKDVLGIVIIAESRSSKREPINREKIRFGYAMISQAAAAIENGKLQEQLLEQSKEAVLAMAEAVDKKSPWTSGHSKRVTEFALEIARKLNWTKSQLAELRLTGLLHDIGKIGTPGTILNKEGKLTEDEYAIIRKHPDDGAQIVSRMRQLHGLIPGIRHHHEWYNGKGYPAGLKGTEIPLAARILAVADAYDAMTANRPYRNGLSRREASDRLQAAAGEQFDPGIVKIFLQCSAES